MITRRDSFLRSTGAQRWLSACRVARRRPSARSRPVPVAPHSWPGSATSSRCSSTSASTRSRIASGATGRRIRRSSRPSRLDARQWARTARAAGFRAMILRPSTTTASASGPARRRRTRWPEAPGAAARAMSSASSSTRAGSTVSRAGLYLSPWDRNNPVVRRLAALQRSLLRSAHRAADAATVRCRRCGSTARTAKGRTASGRSTTGRACGALVRKLQPNAVMFSDAGPDVRWCGNEKGIAGDPNWSTVDPAVVPFPGATGPGVTAALQTRGSREVGLAAGRSGHVDPARAGSTIRPKMRACARSTSWWICTSVGGPKLEAAAERAADAGRLASSNRREPVDRRAPIACGRCLPSIGPPAPASRGGATGSEGLS